MIADIARREQAMIPVHRKLPVKNPIYLSIIATRLSFDRFHPLFARSGTSPCRAFLFPPCCEPIQQTKWPVAGPYRSSSRPLIDGY
jgi:hypothetical protein